MYKSKLQQLCQKRRWDLPQYTHWQVGSTHGPRFVASVTVNDLVYESPDGESRTTKEAQNKAAAFAFETLSDDVVPSAETLSSQSQRSESNTAFKSQLQMYAQKRNKEPPRYTTVRFGLPHDPLFKATVVIDGLVFETAKYFRTVREAEHAAAAVALENLLKEETFQQNLQYEPAVPYKNLLQEVVQKDNQLLPVYETVQDPESSLPLFSSSVEVYGTTFKGKVAKTKKQAEANAAKVALDHIKERKQSQSSSGNSTNEKSKSTAPSVSLSPHIRIVMRDQVLPGNHISAPCDSKPPSTDPKSEPIQTTTDCNLGSASQSNPAFIANPISSQQPVLASNKDNSKEGVELSLLCNRIKMYPQKPSSNVPYGAMPLPLSNGKWVAASLEYLDNEDF